MVERLHKGVPLVALLAAALLLFQCSPGQEAAPDESVVPNISSLSAKDAVANKVAKALAEQMSDVAIRE